MTALKTIQFNLGHMAQNDHEVFSSSRKKKLFNKHKGLLMC